MKYGHEMGEQIASINTLLASVSAPIDEINSELYENVVAINREHTLIARPEFVHAHVGVGYKYLPKHTPDIVVCRADVNQGRVVKNSVVYSPFRKEGEPATVVGTRILVGDDSRTYATYDLLPVGSELIVSVLFSRDRAARVGGGLLELSARKK